VRRQRNVYDKKPQCYAKVNRTAHLTARSDKSVAYVTNNKRLYSTFCTVEADRHEASRSLFATAELPVLVSIRSGQIGMILRDAAEYFDTLHQVFAKLDSRTVEKQNERLSATAIKYSSELKFAYGRG